MNDLDLDLDHLKRLCEAATPGPWGWKKGRLMQMAAPESKYTYQRDIGYQETDYDFNDPAREEQAERDAEFIAAARTALPAALDEVSRLRQESMYLQDILTGRGICYCGDHPCAVCSP